ncbi:MAG TPA: SGNH/GDSL hydrolase family protein [Candidatus Paceibacterota bacterium]|nr:SGNH/GDSL hydrolase family protein [Candidatus Paceibacterota bacterium]
MEKTIFAFGDSITYGAWDIENSGWANSLRRHLDQRAETDPDFYTLFYNLGIPGETTDGLVKRLRPEVETRLREGQENIFIFAYGANDAAMIPSEKRFRVPVAQFGANIEAAITTAKEFSSKIMLLNITPVIEEKTLNPLGKDRSRLDNSVVAYNEKLAEVARKNSLPLVDVYGEFRKNDYIGLLDEGDGLHPNTKGHAIIYELVKDHK